MGIVCRWNGQEYTRQNYQFVLDGYDRIIQKAAQEITFMETKSYMK